MKSRGENLEAAYLQLRDYMDALTPGEVPDLWMVCDFRRFILWDRSAKEIVHFHLSELANHVHRFQAIAGFDFDRSGQNATDASDELEDLVGGLFDLLSINVLTDESYALGYTAILMLLVYSDRKGLVKQGSLLSYFNNSCPILEYAVRLVWLVVILGTTETRRNSLLDDRYIDDLLSFYDIETQGFFGVIVSQAMINHLKGYRPSTREMQCIPYIIGVEIDLIEGIDISLESKVGDFESLRTALLYCFSIDWGNISDGIFLDTFELFKDRGINDFLSDALSWLRMSDTEKRVTQSEQERQQRWANRRKL